MPQWRTDAWVAKLAKARWALHEETPDVAADLLQQAIKLNPSIGVSWRMLGNALSQQGKLHEARKIFWESLSLQPDEFSFEAVQNSILQIDGAIGKQATLAGREPSLSEQENATVRAEVESDTKFAKAGNAVAMLLLAERYEYGNGLEKDSAEALKLYRNAANAGNAVSMCKLGKMYFEGEGVLRDATVSFDWYRRSGN